jgi:hypothetical protein
MLRYQLRTLMILLAVGPPLLAVIWNRELLLAPKPPGTELEALHNLAGRIACVSYPVAVILLGTMLRTMRHWWQPPKKTPLTWAALAAAGLAASFVLVYFLTFPPPWSYTSWAAYFAAHGEVGPQATGKR